jgi:hypothetical protein
MLVCHAVLLAGPANAGRASLQLAAAPSVLIADGKSQTTITATIHNADGSLAPDGTTVQFSTSLGTLDHANISTVGGVARAVLTSSATPGNATVMVSTFLGGDSGAAEQSIVVAFSNDHDLVSTNGDSRWLRVDCPQYLVYSADFRIVEAQGTKGSAVLRYGPVMITADSIQVDLVSLVVRARNATIHRGHETLAAAELRYDLYGNEGWAVLPSSASSGPRSVSISGVLLATMPLDSAYVDESIQDNPYKFVDLSPSRVVISARAIAVDPTSTIQFRRATIYSDGKKIISMAYHSMPLQTDQLFGEQIAGFSTDGFFLNVPYYYHMSPNSTGTLYIRNSAVATAGIQSNLPPSLADGARPGLALDLLHTYRTPSGGTGSLVINGLTQSDWGANWTHSERLDAQTNAYFNVDSPTHRGIFATSTFNHQMKDYSLSFSANRSEDPGTQGYAYSSNVVSSYLSSTPHQFGGRRGITMSTSLNWQMGRVSSTVPGLPAVAHNLSSEGLSVHLNTPAMRPDKQTNITNGLTVGDSIDQSTHQTSLNVLATLGASRTLPKKGNLNLNYSFQYDPLLSQFSSQGAATALTSAYLLKPSSVQQNVTMMMSLRPSVKTTYSLSANYGIPYNNESLVSNLFYQADKNWALSTTALYGRSLFGHYQSLRLGLSRRIFNRMVTLSYDTDIHRFNFDFGTGALY